MDPVGYISGALAGCSGRINSSPNLHVSVVICWGWSHELKKRRAWRTGLAWIDVEAAKPTTGVEKNDYSGGWIMLDL